MIVRNNKLIIYWKVSNNKPAAAVATPGKLAKPAAVKIPAGKSISRPGKEIWWLYRIVKIISENNLRFAVKPVTKSKASKFELLTEV